MFEIQKNVPVVQGKGPASKYPWAQMESGDSILVPDTTGGTPEDHQRRISNNAREWIRRTANRKGWSVKTAREGNAVRVWLVKEDREGALEDAQSEAMHTLLEAYGVDETRRDDAAVHLEEAIETFL